MFTYETIIDTVQTGKKQIVKTFVQDKKFQEELNKLIDAQAEFAKGQIKSSLAIAESLVAHASTQLKAFVPAAK